MSTPDGHTIRRGPKGASNPQQPRERKSDEHPGERGGKKLWRESIIGWKGTENGEWWFRDGT